MTEAVDIDLKVVMTHARIKLRKLNHNMKFLLLHKIIHQKKNA